MRLTFDSDTWPSIIQMTRYLFGTGGTICNFWALPDCSLIGQKQGNENNIVYVYTKEIKYQLLHPVYKVMASIREKKGSEKGAPLHYVHFVKYDDAVSFYDAVSDSIRRRGGNRGIFTEEGVDTVAYFGGNHGSRVWKSLKLKKVYFPRTRTSWDKYMFNRIVSFKF